MCVLSTQFSNSYYVQGTILIVFIYLEIAMIITLE